MSRMTNQSDLLDDTTVNFEPSSFSGSLSYLSIHLLLPHLLQFPSSPSCMISQPIVRPLSLPRLLYPPILSSFSSIPIQTQQGLPTPIPHRKGNLKPPILNQVTVSTAQVIHHTRILHACMYAVRVRVRVLSLYACVCVPLSLLLKIPGASSVQPLSVLFFSLGFRGYRYASNHA
ncbi:hypothetical protein BP00DRAFT_267675 [Aspergillus indologenus CBS 114.80]|uniref:Uncharacterized protein n=1 Tax=Aspergillus indologenus CBS 114.80 TaxID=1450541 RepID=A0A2V5IEQ1_9EURO|nr:hypothetical protein BP00DRAFT_267675 [Aspergillus indologenus CBS 114.80]